MARIWQIVQWVVVRCFNCQQIWSGCRTQSEIHTQFTCIVLAALALFPDFIGGFSHLRIFFMATSSFILNAMQKSRADNERKWIMFEAQHLTSPCKFLDLPPPPLGRFCIFEPPLRWRYIVPLCSIVRVHFALHSHSLLLPRGGRQINQWQRDFIVSLTEILPL